MNKSSRLSTAESLHSRNVNVSGNVNSLNYYHWQGSSSHQKQNWVTASSIKSIKCSVGSSAIATTASRSIEHDDTNRQRSIHPHRFSNMFKQSTHKKQLVDGRFLLETGRN